MGRLVALGGLAIGGLIIADLWFHSAVTNKIIGASVTESQLLAGRG